MGHLVVVDADQRAQRALTDLLLKLGHRVDSGDSLAGVRSALHDRPELLFIGAGPGGADIDRQWALLGELGRPARVVWTGPLRELVEPALDAGIGVDFLPIPPRAPAVVALVARHLASAPTERWSGAEFLTEVSGPASRFPPARVAFLAHRVGAAGWLEIGAPGSVEAVAFLGGRVVGLQSAGRIAGALGQAGPADLNRLIGAAIAAGKSPDDALQEVALALGDLLISAPADAPVRWTEAPPPRPLTLPLTVPRMVGRALELRRPAARLRSELGARPSDRLHLVLPDDSEESSWGLSPAALRLIRAAGRSGTLGGIIGAGGADRDDVWLALDYLMQLGLLSTESAQDNDLVGISVEAIPDSSSGAPISAPPSPPPTARAAAAATPPTSAPFSPAPTAPDPAAEALAATLAQLEASTPWEIFELKVPAEVNLEEIDRRFRARSAPMHPDRRVGDSAEVRRLAAECFARIQSARMALDSEELRKEVRERMLASSESRVFVSEADKRSARLLFKRGEAALRAKKYAEAADQLAEAAKLDPVDWEIALHGAQAEWRAERVPPRRAAERLLAIQTERKSSNAEIQFQAGEMLLAAGDEKAAYAAFAVAIEKDPEHTGAQRRLRLRQSRDERAAEAAKPATPIADTLKGLFSWGKKG